MTVTFGDVVAAVHTWVSHAGEEIARLQREVRELWRAIRHRWSTDAEFRAGALRALGTGLGAAVLRGPRATILWIAYTLGELLTLVPRLLDDPTRAYSPAR